MKKILLLITFSIVLSFIGSEIKAQSSEDLLDMCRVIAGDATYVRDFKVPLEAGTPPPVKNTAFLLQRNSYKIVVCNSREYEGELIVEIYDTSRLIATNYIISSGKYYDKITLPANKAGSYRLKMYFKDGKKGSAVVMLALNPK